MHRNKEIILHFSIQILFIKFKSPRFVRIRAFFFTPTPAKPTSQQVNKPTSFRRSDEAEEFALGLLWVRRIRLMDRKHRFNPLKIQLTPIFNEKSTPTLSHRFFKKKLTQIQPIQQNKSKWHVTRCLVDSLTR